MPQFDVTFTFHGTEEEVRLVVDRICENHEPIAMTELVRLSEEDELDLPDEDDEDK